MGPTRLSDILVTALHTVEAAYLRERWPIGLATGFSDLDYILGGLQRSDLILIGARPAVGKTTLAMNIAAHAALRENVAVAYVSTEMSQQHFAIRLLCAEARVNATLLQTARLADREFPQLATAAGRLADASLDVLDVPSLSVHGLRDQLAALSKQIGLVVVDRLDLLRPPDIRGDADDQIAATARALKALACEIGAPVIATVPVDASVEERSVPIPRIGDLPGGGELEETADVVMLLYREELYYSDVGLTGEAELILAKQRNGPEGWVRLTFVAEYGRLENTERKAHVA